MKAGVQSILDAIDNGNIEDFLPFFNNDYKRLLSFLDRHNAVVKINSFDENFEYCF